MAITVVQRVFANTVSSGDTLAFPANVTAGNRIAVVSLHSFQPTTASITDSQGNPHTNQINGAAIGASGRAKWAWTAPITTTGACTITFTCAIGAALLLALYELSGQDGTTPYDTSSDDDTHSGNPVSPGSVTPAVNGSLIVNVAYNLGAAASTAVSPMTEQWDTSGRFVSDYVQPTAAAINPETTSGDPTTALAFCVVFRAAAGGANFRRVYY